MNKQLKRIKVRYERIKTIKPTSSKDRRRIHNKAIKHAEELRQLLPMLPLEYLYDIGDEGQESYDLQGRLDEDLRRLVFCVDHMPVKEAPNTRGWADDYLVKALARLIENPTCHWSPHSDRYEGSFVSLLEKALPQLGISPVKVPAFAERYCKLKKPSR